MEINEKVENSDSEHLNLNYTYNNGDGFNNFNCNNKEKEHSQNRNIGLINDEKQNHVCANCSKLLSTTSTLINEDDLPQQQEKKETVVENHLIFEIEIIEDVSLDNDLPSSNVTAANVNYVKSKSVSVQRIQVKEILSSIYSLNFLHLLSSQTDTNFLDDLNDSRRVNDVNSKSNSAAVNQDMCICSGCAQVLTNLCKYYTQFNQLRTFDSILSKKIHRLDQILENPNLYQIQRPIRSPARSQSQSQCQSQCESDSYGGSVVKCEVLTEEGTDPIIFDDDNDSDPFGSVQTEFDEHESDLWGRQGQDVEPFQPDADADADKTSSRSIIVHKNSSAGKSAKSLGLGPWVRLSRLRNVRVGSPVRVSKLHRSDNSESRSYVIDVEKRQEIIKSNHQVDDGYIDLDFVASGPSDVDNPNDSDFFIESDTISSKRKRKLPLRSNHELKSNNAMKNRIKATELNAEKSSHDKDNSSSGQAADHGRFESIYTSSSDSELELLVKKVNAKKSKAKLKSKGKPKSNPKTKTAAKSKTNSKVKANKAGQDSKSKSKSKPKVNSGSGSDDANANNEETVDAAKYKASKLKSYRRRKARVPNPCWHCPLDFPSQEECAAHTKATHFSPGDFFCLKCSKLCPNKKSYSQHLTICEKLCPGQKLAPYLCTHCGKSFPLKCDLDMHALIHNEEDSFPCSGPNCTFKTKSQLLLNLHFNRMHVEKPKFKVGEDGELNLSEPIIHKCDHCEATFKNDHSRRIHMHNLHDPEGYRKYREYSVAVLARQKVARRLKMKDKSFVCPDCNIDFFSYLRLIGHRKTMHNEATEFVCDQCGKDFLREKSLKYHMKFSHTDIRPFICEHCGKAFKTAHNLKDHVSHTHSEEGRQKYNDLMRRKNQRRKIVAEALLAKKTATSTATSSATLGPDGGSVFGKIRKVKNSISPDLNPSDFEIPSSDASSPLLYPIPGPSGVIQRLVNSWASHS